MFYAKAQLILFDVDCNVMEIAYVRSILGLTSSSIFGHNINILNNDPMFTTFIKEKYVSVS